MHGGISSTTRETLILSCTTPCAVCRVVHAPYRHGDQSYARTERFGMRHTWRKQRYSTKPQAKAKPCVYGLMVCLLFLGPFPPAEEPRQTLRSAVPCSPPNICSLFFSASWLVPSLPRSRQGPWSARIPNVVRGGLRIFPTQPSPQHKRPRVSRLPTDRTWALLPMPICSRLQLYDRLLTPFSFFSFVSFFLLQKPYPLWLPRRRALRSRISRRSSRRVTQAQSQPTISAKMKAKKTRFLSSSPPQPEGA